MTNGDTPTAKRRREETPVVVSDKAPASDASPPTKVRRRIKVAYLCMEFAVREGLELYSGGLGILAGDVVKTAFDRDLPVFGVGILWDEGYTDQTVGKDGKVVDAFPKADRSQFVAVEGLAPFSVTVSGEDIPLRAFTVEGLGKKFFLLEPVEEKHRRYTRRLYQGPDDRLPQEIILGVGAVRLLRSMGHDTDIFHFNEGHAIFAGLELIREKMQGSKKMPFDEALAATKKECVFTTHTPVEAGNETHPVEKVLECGGKSLGFSKEQLERLGGGKIFNMTIAAFSISCRSNAVAKLHQETATAMWATLKPAPKIVAITNGVHVPSWQDTRIRDAFEEEAAVREETGGPIEAPKNLKDDKLWTEHQQAKRELIAEIKKLEGIELSEDSLLVGFARRAATYKRHTLLFYQKASNIQQQWESEKTDKESGSIAAEGARRKPTAPKPKEIPKAEKEVADALASGRLQVVFSGKAHPMDTGGKEQISILLEQQTHMPKGILYLANYNMKIGRLLTRGCDVWLNNPIRPMEASGTSGMKAAMNGVLNCSILDGWWPEGCKHGVTGWQIGSGEDTKEGENADERDSGFLCRVMLDEVLPAYYKDSEKDAWRTMMRNSISMSQWQFSSDRMMNDYSDLMYS